VQKIEIKQAGGYQRLEWVEAPDLCPAPGQVLVRVGAAGVNYADCIVRMGLYESAKKYVGWPITPGFEIAGVVAAVGRGVETFAVGDRVFGVSRFGGYATEVSVPPEQLFLIPEGMSITQAASIPVVFLTAWYALCELCRLEPGQKVLVHSAAGGVGSAALQIARVLQCEPVGIVGAEHKRAVALENGALEVFVRRDPELWQKVSRAEPAGYAAALDPNGADTLWQSYQALGPMGRLVVYGFSSMIPKGRGTPSYLKLALKYLSTPRFHPLQMTGANKSVMAFNLSYLFERHDLLQKAMHAMLELFGQGRLWPLGVREFALRDAAQAQAALESGDTTGKLVLVAARGG